MHDDYAMAELLGTLMRRECELHELSAGDVFYFRGDLHLRHIVVDFSGVQGGDKVYAFDEHYYHVAAFDGNLIVVFSEDEFMIIDEPK